MRRLGALSSRPEVRSISPSSKNLSNIRQDWKIEPPELSRRSMTIPFAPFDLQSPQVLHV